MAGLPSGAIDPHELLICGICAEPYDDGTHQAKFLTCHHTFCSDCLTQLSNRAQVNPAIIQCPNCRSDTRLPEIGIDGLQSNFYIASVQEISKNSETSRGLANFQACHGHNMEPISYLCLTCGILACHECTIVDHAAKNGHSVISISQTETTYLQELNISQKSLNQNKRNLQLIETEMDLLRAAKENALKDMEKFIKLAHEQLEQRKNDLKDQILDQCNVHHNALLDKQKQIQVLIELINTSNAQAKIITKNDHVSKLKPICESLKEVNEKTQSLFSKLDLGENYFSFDQNKGFGKFKECLQTLGQIRCQGFLPSWMRLRGPEVIVGHRTVLTVEVYNYNGDKVKVPADSLSIQVTDRMDTEIPTQICTTGPNCTVTFTPQISGLHQVSGIFLGQKLTSEQTHISVASNNPVLKFGKKGDGNGTFNWPFGIAIDNNDILYVADRSNRLVQKFSANGEFLSQFSVNDHDKDCTMLKMALDQNNGLIYCTDIVLKDKSYSAGNHMLVFNRDGEFQHIHTLSDVPNPVSIAINNHSDMILISDIDDACLIQVDKEGNNLCCMGDFEYPADIAIADDDSIIVPDNGNDCIHVLNADGSARHRFGSSGSGEGQLRKPWGVTTDGKYILVADTRNNRIQVFTCDGIFVSTIVSKDDPLKDPYGLAVTKDGHVYVADSGNHCIKKFKYRDVT